MILTGAKLEWVGKKLYGAIWVSRMSEKLARTKRTIMRMRDRKSGHSLALQRQLLEIVDTQIAELEEVRNELAETFDDAG